MALFNPQPILRGFSSGRVSGRGAILTHGRIGLPKVASRIEYLRRRDVAPTTVSPGIARIRAVAQDTGVVPDPVGRQAAICAG